MDKTSLAIGSGATILTVLLIGASLGVLTNNGDGTSTFAFTFSDEKAQKVVNSYAGLYHYNNLTMNMTKREFVNNEIRQRCFVTPVQTWDRRQAMANLSRENLN